MSRYINPMQRRAINRVIRFYRERNSYTGCTSVRVELEPTSYGTFWLRVWTRRSDCAPGSPRGIFCEESAFISVGRRGAIKVARASSGLRKEPKHVAQCLRGTVT